MPVRKIHYPGTQPSPILRHPNAPFCSISDLNPEPSTDRGRRRSGNKPEYVNNLSDRQKQSSPCPPSREAHRGPHHRAKATGSSEWTKLMVGRYTFDY